MSTVGVAIICKTPEAGKSKTRLSPPLTPLQCAAISQCFIRDLSSSIDSLAQAGDVTGYALYTPVGSEERLREILPKSFRLISQSDGDLGDRLLNGVKDILRRGHEGAVIINADSPTLPMGIIDQAVTALRQKDCVVLSPAIDGGYTAIGLREPHARLFRDIPWSTEAVHRLTVQRAAEMDLDVVNTDAWYDVDDKESLALLRADLRGDPLPFGPHRATSPAAPATRAFLETLALDAS